MNHRDHIELERASTKTQLFTFRNDMNTLLRYIVIPFEHRNRLGICHNHQVRIPFKHVAYQRRMVRLHMINDKVIYLTIAYRLCNVYKKLILETGLYCIYQRNLLINNKIRIIAYSIREGPKTLKQNLVCVIDPNRIYSLCQSLHMSTRSKVVTEYCRPWQQVPCQAYTYHTCFPQLPRT